MRNDNLEIYTSSGSVVGLITNKVISWDDIPYAEEVNVLKKVKPKQGRVVVFDGLHWHTAEQPTKDVRCIINFNISTNGT